jgi:EAL and modified HD-GYP domain-containing signal transduction protein
MTEVFVARQPIFDRGLRVSGYELLFRHGPADAAAVLDAEDATATVLLNSLTEIGWERIVGSRKAWINVSREFVLSGLLSALPAANVTLEILEHEVIDAQLVNACEELRLQGYTLALDDFAFSLSARPLLKLVDVVKLDMLALGADGMRDHIAMLRPYGVTLVAEKVETVEEHALCSDLGCDLFQGYFFCKPQLLSGGQINASRLAVLELIGALQDPTTELEQLEALIRRDVALSMRLLRYINSAFFGLRFEVNSIRQALALLGLENLKSWATLTVFASVEDKPTELTVTALTRARFCELAGPKLGHVGRSQLFTLGLFSVIDALMDAPMEEALSSIPFPAEMLEALIEHRGPMGTLLGCVTAVEAGDFDRAEALVPAAGELHVESIVWADEAAAGLLGGTGTLAA